MNDDSLRLASGVLLLRGTVSAGSLAATNKETGLERDIRAGFVPRNSVDLHIIPGPGDDSPEKDGSMGTNYYTVL